MTVSNRLPGDPSLASRWHRFFFEWPAVSLTRSNGVNGYRGDERKAFVTHGGRTISTIAARAVGVRSALD